MKQSNGTFWRTHFAIITLAIFAIGLGTILLSQQTSLLVIGATGLIFAHVAAFGGAFLFGGGWLAKKIHEWMSK